MREHFEQDRDEQTVESRQDFFDSRALRMIMPFVTLAIGGFCALVTLHIGSMDTSLANVIKDEKVLEAVVNGHERIFRQVDTMSSDLQKILQQLPLITVLQKEIDDGKVDTQTHIKLDADRYHDLKASIDDLSKALREHEVQAGTRSPQ